MASLVSHSSRRHCSRVSYLHAAGGYDLPEVGGAGGTQRPNHTVWGMCFPALYRTHIHFSHAIWIRRDWLWWVSVFTRWNIDDPQSLKDKTSHCVLKLDCQFKLFMNVPLTYDPPHVCAQTWLTVCCIRKTLECECFPPLYNSEFQSSGPEVLKLLLFFLNSSQWQAESMYEVMIWTWNSACCQRHKSHQGQPSL